MIKPVGEALSKFQFVAYYRVSTDKQGRSGLGLDAQREAVAEFIRLHNGELLGEFEEVESGRKVESERPALAQALQGCRAYRARLLVTKLDRLARNAAFLHRLRESGIRFTCCDMPDANELTVGILALVAEDEARRISERTKVALAAAKRRICRAPCGSGAQSRASAPSARLGACEQRLVVRSADGARRPLTGVYCTRTQQGRAG